MRKDSSSGMNGMVMDMVVSERSFDIWVSLFEVYMLAIWESAFLMERECDHTSAEEIRKGGMHISWYFSDIFGQ